MRFRYYIPISDGERLRWFTTARSIPCIAGNAIFDFVGFRVERDRDGPDRDADVGIVCRRLPPHLLNCVRENNFVECEPPGHV